MTTRKQPARRSSRRDDWTNTMSGLGIRDKSVGLGFTRRARLQKATLEALYEQSAIVARAVDKIVDDALREGFELEHLPFGIDFKRDVLPRLKELRFVETLSETLKWSRLYGGAGMTIGAIEQYPSTARRSRSPADTPYMPAAGQRVGLVPCVSFHAYELVPDKSDGAFHSPTFRQVLTYQVTTEDTPSFDIHRSRLLVFEPIKLPREALQRSETRWGPSVVERLWDSLGKYGSAMSHAVAMMYVSSVLCLKMVDFRKAHKTKDGKTQLREIAQAVSATLSSTGILTIDKEDELANFSLAVTGAHDLIDDTRSFVAESADMPREILFNESPTGLRGGELSGAQELWFGRVQAFREDEIAPAILEYCKTVLPVLFPGQAESFSDIQVKWPELWVKSDTEASQTASQNATADNLYFQMGALSADEIRQARFVEGSQGAIVLETEDEFDGIDLSSADVEAYEQAANAEPLSEGDVVADQALNGAQIASLVGLVEKVVAGLIPRDAAISIIAASFPSVAGRAEALLGSAGLGAAPTPAVVPQAAPAAPVDAGPPASTDPMPADLVSPRDAAAKFGIPTRAVTRQIEIGKLRYWGLGAHKRVSLAELAELARAHEVSNEPGELDDPALAEEPEDDGENEAQ